MRTFAAILAVAAFAGVMGDCPNACSGHGDCSTNHDFCTCWSGYMGADCSERTCPFGLSFIDTPNGDHDHDGSLATGGYGSDFTPQFLANGWWERHPAQLYGDGSTEAGGNTVAARLQEGHFYAECSNRGLCNRASGMCDCFTGFEGAACNRTACPNDCSGHGVCESMRDLTPDEYYYNLWDSEKSQLCSCDGGWGGIDCSQRLCKRADDPLTETTTRAGYNAGLAETAEVQVIEFRCPYNGKIISTPEPMMTLTYTDEFGDSYTTAAFNPIDDSEADIAAALKALPNQVLADYSVDGVVQASKVSSVSRTTILADYFYSLEVTFDSSMGDVAMLEANPMFTCQGGAEVNTDGKFENIYVTYTADGPAQDLIFNFEVTADSGSSDTFVLTVTDADGNAYAAAAASEAIQAGAFTPSSADSFTPEAEKVSFQFEGGAQSSAFRGADGTVSDYSVRIHTTPVATVRNPQFDTTTGSVIVTVNAAGDTVTATAGTALAWDAVTKLEYLGEIDDGSAERFGLTIDGEFRGYISIDTTAEDVATIDSSLNTVPSVYDGTLEASTGAFGATAGAAQTIYQPKDLATNNYVISATGPDSIDLTYAAAGTYADGEWGMPAPSRSYNLVIKICSTSTATDTYTWKLAGDDVWAHELAGASGSCYNIPSSGLPAALDEVSVYLADEGVRSDDASRAGLAWIRLTWNDGADFGDRVCGNDVNMYYFQTGLNGLNDAPECANRGLCDYSTGLCKCFKGYAGINCASQNALAMGSGAGL